MTTIRRFRSGDEPALSRICLLTGDRGSDATGVLDDDELWGELFVLPYVARHPDFAFVVVDEADVPIGYIVATPDTRAFEDWFREEWWPGRAERYRRAPDGGAPVERQDVLVHYADSRRGGAEPFGDTHPAHLHIDLLPEAQGAGWGRRLIDTLVAELTTRGVTGVHLVAGADNAGAVAFYPRVGFVAAESPPGAAVFTRDLADASS